MKNLSVQKFVTVALPLLILGLAFLGRTLSLDAAGSLHAQSGSDILPASEVQWTPLNPARGDASPQAGTLWGDRAGSLQTGFLVKFADGFSSPPHIHNVTYRGVVISGEIHNDDPDAEKLWMPAGSFWTQPAGEVHITAAQGEENVAYIEIDRGPYLVLSSDQANDNGERPINVHESNLVWLGSADTTWITTKGPEMAFLWGTPKKGKTNGTLIKFPAGFEGELHSEDAPLKAVVIKGQPQVRIDSESKSLEPGSYFLSTEDSAASISSSSEQPSLFYLRSEGRFKILPKSN